MSLFSNLLRKAAEAVEDVENSIPDDTKKKFGEFVETLGEQAKVVGEKIETKAKEYGEKVEANAAAKEAEAAGTAPAGTYWGPEKPAEENQYSYPGTYKEYFSHIFAEDFPEYQVDMETPANRNAAIYTFSQLGQTKLVVEVVGQNSKAKALRRDSLRSGIPYLRFYHNHFGWWNVRSYVAERVKNAL